MSSKPAEYTERFHFLRMFSVCRVALRQPGNYMTGVKTNLSTQREQELELEILRTWQLTKPAYAELGKLLYEMHTLKAVRGRNGGFAKFLREIELPRSTAYDLMNRFAEANNLPLKGKRLPEIEDPEDDANSTGPYDSNPVPNDNPSSDSSDPTLDLSEYEGSDPEGRDLKDIEEMQPVQIQIGNFLLVPRDRAELFVQSYAVMTTRNNGNKHLAIVEAIIYAANN